MKVSYITGGHLCVKPAAPGFIWNDISVHTHTVAIKSLIFFKSVKRKHVWGFLANSRCINLRTRCISQCQDFAGFYPAKMLSVS